MMDLTDLTALEAAELIANGKLSSVELTRAYLARIRARNEVAAWCHVNEEFSLAQAAAADASPPRSRLHGIPFGVKDVIDTADLPTEYGSPIHMGHRPRHDASCVAKMRDGGAVLLGKLVTTEFALYTPRATRHPLDPRRTPGGSSSGTGAAVADRQVPIAFGNQTAGSLIRPAAFCGVFGLKPTHGLVALDGIHPLQPLFDTLGYMARSVEDLAAFFELVSGLSAPVRGSASRPPRIGLCRTHQWEYAEPETRFILDAVANKLAASDCDVEEFSMPDHYAAMIDIHRALLCRGVAEALEHDYEAAADQISESARAMIAEGRELSDESYAAQRSIVEQCRAAINQDFGEFDALLCPSTPGEAPIGTATGNPIFQVTWTLLGVPCINLPLGTGPSGMPVGVQLIGRRHDDIGLLTLAKNLLERASPVDMRLLTDAAA